MLEFTHSLMGGASLHELFLRICNSWRLGKYVFEHFDVINHNAADGQLTHFISFTLERVLTITFS